MALENLLNLQERINNVLAQGLMSIASQDELDALVRELSELNLEQPAALLRRIQQNAAERKMEKQDVESLIKVLQILYQAEIQLSEAATLEIENLEVVQGCKAVYVMAGETVEPEQLDLNEIIAMPDNFARGHLITEYFKQAGYDELVRSIEIVWFDYSLGNFIAEGLRGRPEEAIKLAQLAMKYKKNLVMQRIAVKVLETAGMDAADPQGILEVLKQASKKSKEPVKYFFMEAIAKIEGTYAEYLKTRKEKFKAHAEDIQKLSARKKGERSKAIRALAKTKDPCFTEVLLRAVEDKDWQVRRTALQSLVKVGGFDAIAKLYQMMEGETLHTAAEVLYKFGDRKGLQYFLGRKFLFPLETYVPFTDFGLLIVNPLLNIIKRIKEPEQLKTTQGIFNLFALLRSKEFARKIAEYLENDPVLAENFAAIMKRVYPAQCEKILKGLKGTDTFPYPPEALQELVSTILSGDVDRIVKHLRHKYLVYNTLVTPDGKYVMTLDAHGEVHLWKTEKWKKEISFTLKHKPQYYYLNQFALTPDGKYLLVTNNRDTSVEILEFGNWESCLASLKHATAVHSVAASSDGKYILGGGKDTVKVWEFDSRKEVAELQGHSNGIEVVKAVPDRHCVVTGDRNGLIQVWEEESWKKIAGLKVNNIIANSVAISPDGKYIIGVETLARYLETKVKIWETGNWQEAVDLTISSRTPVTCFAFTPDRKYLITGSDVIKFLEVGSWKEVLQLANNDTRAIAVTPDGKYIIAGMNVWQVDLSFVNN